LCPGRTLISSLPDVKLSENYLLVDDRVRITYYLTLDGKFFTEERVSIDLVDVDSAVSRFETVLRRATAYHPNAADA
jgi:hypothetical protein